jgi:hypothetical protein
MATVYTSTHSYTVTLCGKAVGALLKVASVIHLEFKLFIAQVEKLLDNKHLEKD